MWSTGSRRRRAESGERGCRPGRAAGSGGDVRGAAWWGAPGTCLRPGRGAVAGDSDVDECGWRLLRQVRLRGEWFISWSECCSGLVMEMDITKMIFLPRQTYGGIIRFNKIDHS